MFICYHVVFNYIILCYLFHASLCVENSVEYSLTKQLINTTYSLQCLLFRQSCVYCTKCNKILNSVSVLSWYSSLQYLSPLCLFANFNNIPSEVGGWGKLVKVRNMEADAHSRSQIFINLRCRLSSFFVVGGGGGGVCLFVCLFWVYTLIEHSGFSKHTKYICK